MLLIPNYNVVVPVIPSLRLYTNRRTDREGDRAAKIYNITVEDCTYLELPFTPASREWVEVYINGIKLINPRITNIDGGTLYEVFNLDGNAIRFNQSISGNLKIICDTKAAHWWGSLMIHPDNVQTLLKKKELNNFIFMDYPVAGGQITGFNYRVNVKPGAKFKANSYVIIDQCEPAEFNGNYQVISSDLGTVRFRGNVALPNITTMSKIGVISGVSDALIDVPDSIGLYAEPVVITQPYHGYARLSTDRKSIAYVPNRNYVGNDSFSWTLITQHGQIGDPQCVNIKVRRPAPVVTTGIPSELDEEEIFEQEIYA